MDGAPRSIFIKPPYPYTYGPGIDITISTSSEHLPSPDVSLSELQSFVSASVHPLPSDSLLGMAAASLAQDR